MALHHAIGRAAISNQGSLIVGVVLLAFIVYVTLKNHLGSYLADLGIGARTRARAIAGGAAGGAAGGGGGGLYGGLPAIPALPSIAIPPLPNAIAN